MTFRLPVFLIAILTTALAQGQSCCPFINGLSVDPQNPSDTDQVSVIVDVSTPSQGSVVSLQHSLNGFQVDLDGCYYSGMLPTVDQHLDTITLGTLPAGQYNVNFTARQSTDPNNCVPNDSTTSSMSFTVSASSGPSFPCCIQIDSLYLDPASGIDDTTDVRAIAEVTTPAPGSLLNFTIQGFNDSAHIEACYYSDTTPSPQTHRDTFSLGTFPEGRVTLHFYALQSDDSTNCSPTDTAQASLSFQVDSTSSGMGLRHQEEVSFSIYPNPVQRHLRIERPPFGKKPVRIHSPQGALLWEGEMGEKTRIDLTDWKPGWYVLSVGDESRRFLIQR